MRSPKAFQAVADVSRPASLLEKGESPLATGQTKSWRGAGEGITTGTDKGVRQVSGNATKERNVKTTTEKWIRERRRGREIQVAGVWGGVPDRQLTHPTSSLTSI